MLKRKEFKLLSLILIVMIVLTGCSTSFNAALLQPTHHNLNPKLPYLEIKEYDNKIIYGNAGKEIPVNSKMYTLFERELSNFCEMDGDKKGEIEAVVTIAEANLNYGWYAVSALTFFTVNLLGAPLYSTSLQLEVEFNIYNLDGRKIFSRNYYNEENITSGFYYNMGFNADNYLMEMYRSFIRDFKKDLQPNVESLNNKLFSAK